MSRQYPSQVIDIHTHVFNARHVPLVGVLVERGVPAFFAKILATILELLTQGDDAETSVDNNFIDEITKSNSLTGLSSLFSKATLNSTAIRIRRLRLVYDSEHATAHDIFRLQHQLQSDPMYQALEELDALYQQVGARNNKPGTAVFSDWIIALSKLTSDIGSGDKHLQLSADELIFRFEKPLRWAIKYMARHVEADEYGDALSYVRFFLLMLSREDGLASRLFSSYRKEQNVSTVLSLMMDMQYAYKGHRSPHYPYPKQIERMADIQKADPNRHLFFIAFDPRRKDAVKIVTKAIMSGIFVGGKIYPPMGYLPSGSTEREKQEFDDLYRQFTINDWPLLTHCTPVGFQAYKGSGILSDPANWEPVLKQHNQLRLCFGHGGGGSTTNILAGSQDRSQVLYEGWYAEKFEQNSLDTNYAFKIFHLCLEYPNVYCDLSHLDEIVADEEKRERLRCNLIYAFSQGGESQPFSNKVMYGSDWHMPLMCRQTEKYLDCFIDIFDSCDVLRRHKEKFFSINAKRFLRLPG